MAVSQQQKEVLREVRRNEEYRQWLSERAATIRNQISAFDICRYFAVDLKSAGEHEEQIICPFHADNSPSARIYPRQGDSSSGIYCWTCQKRWDVFNLWRQFNSDEERKFGTVIFEIEKAFGIIPPEGPTWETGPVGPTEEEKEVWELLSVCERRMQTLRTTACDMVSFLKLGKLLDQLHYQMRHKTIQLDEADRRVRLILDKIGEKIRRG